jgi:hypothetical protein
MMRLGFLAPEIVEAIVAGQLMSRCWRFLVPPPSRMTNFSPSLPK